MEAAVTDAAPGEQGSSMLLSAGEILTGDETLRPGWLEVSAGRVVATGRGVPPRPADLDLPDSTVTPGFVDTHVHGGGGASFSDATTEATGAAASLHLSHGTTTLVASLVSADVDSLHRQVEALSGQVEDGLLAGIHLEGPWLSPRRCGAHEPSALRAPDLAELDALLAASAGTIRMVTLAPELPGALEAIRHVVEAGAVAAVGHTDGTYHHTRSAIEAGATVATHLFNAMRAVHHREPGPVVALLEDEGVTLEMITDGTHLHPALYRHVVATAGVDRVSLVTDAMAAAGRPDGDYLLGPLAVEVADGVATLAGTDTIAGSTATMDQLFRFAVAHGGPDRAAALDAAVRQTSVGPARALGLPSPVLAAGASADLVVLDGALNVTHVMRCGTWSPASPAAGPRDVKDVDNG